MATIDLGGVARELGDLVADGVKATLQSVALPADLRAKGLLWAEGVATNITLAGIAKAAGDQAGFDASMREIGFYGQAAKAVATAEVLLGLATAEVEARKALVGAVNLGISLASKILLAAIV